MEQVKRGEKIFYKSKKCRASYGAKVGIPEFWFSNYLAHLSLPSCIVSTPVWLSVFFFVRSAAADRRQLLRPGLQPATGGHQHHRGHAPLHRQRRRDDLGGGVRLPGQHRGFCWHAERQTKEGRSRFSFKSRKPGFRWLPRTWRAGAFQPPSPAFEVRRNDEAATAFLECLSKTGARC